MPSKLLCAEVYIFLVLEHKEQLYVSCYVPSDPGFYLRIKLILSFTTATIIVRKCACLNLYRGVGAS